MNILLDTHIFLWWVQNEKLLSKSARSFIREANEVYVSSVSILEAAIKANLGKLAISMDALTGAIVASGFRELPLTAIHAANVKQLPNLHKDPFDRVLVAQAISEPLKFLTADKKLKKYSELVEVV